MVSPGSMTASLDTSGTSAARWVTPLECRGPRRRKGRPQGVRRTGVPDRAQAREERNGLAGTGVALGWETRRDNSRTCDRGSAPLARRTIRPLRRRWQSAQPAPGGGPLQAQGDLVGIALYHPPLVAVPGLPGARPNVAARGAPAPDRAPRRGKHATAIGAEAPSPRPARHRGAGPAGRPARRSARPAGHAEQLAQAGGVHAASHVAGPGLGVHPVEIVQQRLQRGPARLVSGRLPRAAPTQRGDRLVDPALLLLGHERLQRTGDRFGRQGGGRRRRSAELVWISTTSPSSRTRPRWIGRPSTSTVSRNSPSDSSTNRLRSRWAATAGSGTR